MDSLTQQVLEKIDKDEIIELAKDLVRIPSPHEEREVAEYVVEWCRENDIEANTQEFAENRCNAVAKIPGTNPEDGNSLTLNAHLDTGQGTMAHDGIGEYLIYGNHVDHPSFQTEPSQLEDGRWVGAGLNNDKGPLASALVAAKAIQKAGVELDGDLVVAGCGGETGGAHVDEYEGPRYLGHGVGTRHLINNGGTTDYAVILETSKMGVAWGNPGLLFVKLTVPGEWAYIPYIHTVGTDNNAIKRATELVDPITEWGKEYTEENIYEYEAGQVRPHVNVGAIRSGHPIKPTVQPGIALLYVDIRVPPNRAPTDVEREFRRFIHDRDPTVTVEAYKAIRGHAPSSDGGIDELKEAIEETHRSVFGESPPERLNPEQHSRWHDTNIYHEQGIPCVKWAAGPGGLNPEIPRYSLSEDEFMDGAKGYAALALDVCGVAE